MVAAVLLGSALEEPDVRGSLSNFCSGQAVAAEVFDPRQTHGMPGPEGEAVTPVAADTSGEREC